MKILILVILFAFASGHAHAEIGMASWYGHYWAGKKTASGAIFNPHGYTAASWNYKFGTHVLVTNLKNNKSVVVRINDRGPAHRLKRLIDLSQAAAIKIGMLKSGICMVKVEKLN
jgi:rare lipoprotein A